MTNPQYPLVTIITPVYNRADYIEEVISSVLNQGYPHLQYIVLDDGSTDNSVEIIKKFEGKITWESHKNMGEARTLNKAFSMAKGDFISIVNSDDPLLPGCIFECVKVLQENPDAVAVHPDWDMIDSNGKIIQNTRPPDLQSVYMVSKQHCPGPGVFFRRSALEKCKGRDTEFRFVGDFDLWIRMSFCGRFIKLNKTLATWRFHEANTTGLGKGALIANEQIKLLDKIYSMPDIPHELLPVKQEAYSAAYYIAAKMSKPTDYKFILHNFFLAFRHFPLKCYFTTPKRLCEIVFYSMQTILFLFLKTLHLRG